MRTMGLRLAATAAALTLAFAGRDPWKARLDFVERAAQAPPQPRP